MQSYEGEGYSIAFPADWQQQEDAMGADVMALDPREGGGDSFRENVNVYVDDVPSGMDREAYLQKSEQTLRRILTDYQVLESDRVRLNGVQAARRVLSHRMGQYGIKALAYWMVDGGKGYSITCTAEADKFDEYLDQFERICRTFRLD